MASGGNAAKSSAAFYDRAGLVVRPHSGLMKAAAFVLPAILGRVFVTARRVAVQNQPSLRDFTPFRYGIHNHVQRCGSVQDLSVEGL